MNLQRVLQIDLDFFQNNQLNGTALIIYFDIYCNESSKSSIYIDLNFTK